MHCRSRNTTDWRKNRTCVISLQKCRCTTTVNGEVCVIRPRCGARALSAPLFASRSLLNWDGGQGSFRHQQRRPRHGATQQFGSRQLPCRRLMNNTVWSRRCAYMIHRQFTGTIRTHDFFSLMLATLSSFRSWHFGKNTQRSYASRATPEFMWAVQIATTTSALE